MDSVDIHAIMGLRDASASKKGLFRTHIGCKSSLPSYTCWSSNSNSYSLIFTLVARIAHVHVQWTLFMFMFIFKFKFIFTRANLMFSIHSTVRISEASRLCDKSDFLVSYFHNSLCSCTLYMPLFAFIFILGKPVVSEMDEFLENFQSGGGGSFPI